MNPEKKQVQDCLVKNIKTLDEIIDNRISLTEKETVIACCEAIAKLADAYSKLCEYPY